MIGGARAIAHAVAGGRVTAESVTRRALAAIARDDRAINAFTAVLAEQALADARAVDAVRAAGRPLGPLAGAPVAVKNLYDIAGLTTLAGAKIRAAAAPAARDAVLVARLRAAGAVLLGALNMDEFAYGFVTENAHYGPTRNPHDLSRICGGSSGGSAAAVAAGMVPLTLGTDTNGSIRVPAALCGVWGLKPTLGRLPKEGVFPFVDSLDHPGLFAAALEDLAEAYEVLAKSAGSEATACLLGDAEAPLRVAVLGGWFVDGIFPEAQTALERAAGALGAAGQVALHGAAAARSAAFCLTAFEGARLHAADLAGRAADYDPAVRDRLLAGLHVPAQVAAQARAFRRVFRDEAARLFETFDILLAPATPCPAPPIGAAAMRLNGQDVSVRRNLGAYAQPISFIGLPVIAAPVFEAGALPVGVQIIAPPWREDLAFAAARRLELAGVAIAHPPSLREI